MEGDEGSVIDMAAYHSADARAARNRYRRDAATGSACTAMDQDMVVFATGVAKNDGDQHPVQMPNNGHSQSRLRRSA